MKRLKRPLCDTACGPLIYCVISLTGLFLIGQLVVACQPPPPNLSPAAVTAWKAHEIQKDLDLIRDIAQDANAQVPPLISTEATRRITLWHQTAIQLVHDAPAGWKQTVLNGLDSLKDNVPAAEYRVIAQYVALAKVILLEAP